MNFFARFKARTGSTILLHYISHIVKMEAVQAVICWMSKTWNVFQALSGICRHLQILHSRNFNFMLDIFRNQYIKKKNYIKLWTDAVCILSHAKSLHSLYTSVPMKLTNYIWENEYIPFLFPRRGVLGPVHKKTIVNANARKRIYLSPSTRKRSSFT